MSGWPAREYGLARPPPGHRVLRPLHRAMPEWHGQRPFFARRKCRSVEGLRVSYGHLSKDYGGPSRSASQGRGFPLLHGPWLASISPGLLPPSWETQFPTCARILRPPHLALLGAALHRAADKYRRAGPALGRLLENDGVW